MDQRSSIAAAHLPVLRTANPHQGIGRVGRDRIDVDVSSYSLDQERLVGAKLAKAQNAHVQILEDPAINGYVNRIVSDIARHSDAQSRITVAVVHASLINAYSLPGGFIYVNTGLILAADDEASFASIIAHEIAHIAARDGVKYLVQSPTFTGPSSAASFYRALERDADHRAMAYVVAAGYDPTAFMRFCRKLDAQHLVPHADDHPPLKERITNAQLAIATEMPRERVYLVNTMEFNDIKARVLHIQDSHRRTDDVSVRRR